MSLLLDALKKAADDKKASKADSDTGSAHADTVQGLSTPEHTLTPSSALTDKPPLDSSSDDGLLTLEPIEPGEGEQRDHDRASETGPEGDIQADIDASSGVELSLDEQPAEALPGVQPDMSPERHAGTQAEDAHQSASNRAQKQTGPALTVSPAIRDSGSDRTISDEALNMLIYNSNRDIRKQRIATVTSMIIISLLVLLSGGFYFYTDMQAEIASLERQHSTAMLAMQAKTSSEQAPKQSEIIRNLVSDKGLDEKVQFARDKMSAGTQLTSTGKPENTTDAAASGNAVSASRQVSENRKSATTANDDDGQALLSIQKSRSIDPIENKLEQAWLAYDIGDRQTSRRLYSEVLSAEPQNRDALLGIGAISIVEGDQRSAIDAYIRLLELDPTDPIASAALSDLRTSDSNAGEVERYLVNMLQKNPESSPLNFATGNFYARRGQWQDAQKHYFIAWNNDADNADYLFNLAVSMDQLNKPEQALGFYRDSLVRAGDRQVSFSREAVRKRIAALSE